MSHQLLCQEIDALIELARNQCRHQLSKDLKLIREQMAPEKKRVVSIRHQKVVSRLVGADADPARGPHGRPEKPILGVRG